MSDADYLSNHLLIAMPGVVDGYFDHSVTLLCEHTPEGAMGLVINRPTDLSLGKMLGHMDIQLDNDAQDYEIFWGGPVQPERGFVLHDNKTRWESTLEISDDLCLTTSRDVLEAMATGKGPESVQIMLGYAGWGAGQLEDEMLQNSWLSTQSNKQIIFNTAPEMRWQASLSKLGVDPHLLTSQAGHA